MSSFDKQKSGLAGELFVAAELLKRGFQVSITFGNAKAIDLFAYKEEDNKTYNIQVKTLKRPNSFPLQIDNVNEKYTYVFVLLNAIGAEVEYFIINGKEIIQEEKYLFGKGGGKAKMAGISLSKLRDYKNKWEVIK